MPRAKRKASGPPAIKVTERISTSSGTVYEIRISRTDGKLYCTCRGWPFKKRCKHTEDTSKHEILEALERECKTGVLGI